MSVGSGISHAKGCAEAAATKCFPFALECQVGLSTAMVRLQPRTHSGRSINMLAAENPKCTPTPLRSALRNAARPNVAASNAQLLLCSCDRKPQSSHRPHQRRARRPKRPGLQQRRRTATKSATPSGPAPLTRSAPFHEKCLMPNALCFLSGMVVNYAPCTRPAAGSHRPVL